MKNNDRKLKLTTIKRQQLKEQTKSFGMNNKITANKPKRKV